MTGAPLRCCAGCAGSFLGDNRPGSYHRPRCTAEMPPWDPQPNDSVRLHTDRIARYLVLARDGETLTLRRLGFPEERSFTRRGRIPPRLRVGAVHSSSWVIVQCSSIGGCICVRFVHVHVGRALRLGPVGADPPIRVMEKCWAPTGRWLAAAGDSLGTRRRYGRIPPGCPRRGGTPGPHLSRVTARSGVLITLRRALRTRCTPAPLRGNHNLPGHDLGRSGEQ